MADGTTKPIEYVREDDMILAVDPEGNPGPARAYRVAAKMTNFTERVVSIQVGSVEAIGEFEATGEHPFWTMDSGWVAAHALERGDRLLDSKGHAVEVLSVLIEDRYSPTHNLMVEGVHTYYVVSAGHAVLVHNHSIEDAVRAQAPVEIPKNAVLHKTKITKATGAWNLEWRWESKGLKYAARFHSPSPGAVAVGDMRNVWIVQRGTGWGNPLQVLAVDGKWLPYALHIWGQTGRLTHLSSARGAKITPCP